MAANAVIQVTGNISGGASGGKVFGPYTLTSSAACTTTVLVPLVAGDSTVVVPVATLMAPTGCFITLPSNNTALVRVKELGADTGIIIGKASTTQSLNWLASAGCPVNIILNAIGMPARI